MFELDDLVGRGRRAAPAAPRRPAASRSDLDGCRRSTVDPVFLDEALDERRSRTPSSTRRPDAPIRIGARRPADGLVRLTVEDGGPGVPADALPRLFDKFYRVPGRAGGSRSRDRHRPGGRPRPGRGDGRPGRRAAERARRARDRPRPAARRPPPAAPIAGDAAMTGRQSDRAARPILSSRTTTRRDAAARSRACAPRATAIDGGGRRPRRPLAALGGAPARPRPARPRPARHGRPRRHPARSGARPRRRSSILSGAIRGAREGRGAGARRRRLRHQAVRRRRAQRPASASRCGEPPGPAADATGEIVVGPLDARRRAPRGHASAATPVDLTPREFEILASC